MREMDLNQLCIGVGTEYDRKRNCTLSLWVKQPLFLPSVCLLYPLSCSHLSSSASSSQAQVVHLLFPLHHGDFSGGDSGWAHGGVGRE